MPMAIIVRPRRNTIFRTSLRGAPSAMRTPISWVCRLTEYAITLKMPIATNDKPIKANTAKRINPKRGCA